MERKYLLTGQVDFEIEFYSEQTNSTKFSKEILKNFVSEIKRDVNFISFDNDEGATNKGKLNIKNVKLKGTK